MTEPRSHQPSGLPYALGAYTIWGLLPLYLMLVHAVPPFEFVGWRILFTLPFCFVIVLLRGQLGDVRRALRNRGLVARLCLSALLIGGNWLVYIAAIQQGHVFAASLGYYINPLVNVVLATVFLGERLSTRQWIAVAIAGAGVASLAWGAADMLWISLALALSFASYGLVRRSTEVGSLPGLTIESALLVLPAAGIVAFYAQSPGGSALGRSTSLDLLVMASGAVTAIPLLMFATAARRMSFSALGFVQFLSPTLAFLLGLFVFHEPLRPIQLACFLAIWSAIALFCWDLWQRSRAATPTRV